MDSIKFLKGYGKVNPDRLEDENHDDTTQKRQTTIAKTSVVITILLLLVFISGLTIGLLILNSRKYPPAHNSPSSPLKTVCDVTQYPSTCLNSMSSLNLSTRPNPEIIFKFSLEVSMRALSNISSQFTSLNDAASQSAVDDCVSLFDNALRSVNHSFNAMVVPRGENMLSLEKVNDIRTWVSAAMTDQETCLDGLKEMDQMASEALIEMMDSVEKSKELLSNSLAIVANMDFLLQKFGLKIH